MLWTFADFDRRLCSHRDVGKPKPLSPLVKLELAVEDVILDALPTPQGGERLRRDAMAAYDHLGGAAWLAAHPDLLRRLLLKIAEEPAPAPNVIVTVNAPWLSPQRLTYAPGDDGP